MDASTRRPRGEYEREQTQVNEYQPRGDAIRRGQRRVADVGVAECVFNECLVTRRLAHHLVAGAQVPGERKRRDEERGGEKGDAPVAVPELGAEPEMDADARMDPHGEQCRY